MLERFSLMVGQAFARLASLKREEGQGTVEYAIIVFLVIGAALAVAGVLNADLKTAFTNLGNQIANAIP